jgi:hypothetical protein
MRKERPRVGIIFSSGQNVSNTSAYLAKYLGAHLAATGLITRGDLYLQSRNLFFVGWCTICLIPFSPGSIPDLSNDRIRYYPINSSKPVDASVRIFIF